MHYLIGRTEVYDNAIKVFGDFIITTQEHTFSELFDLVTIF